MARRQHPGQRNSLDALCKRYEIDNSQRELHGALLDAEILADVYLMMTGGQASLSLDSHTNSSGVQAQDVRRLPADRPPLRVITATADEQAAHDARLDAIARSCGGAAVWRQLEEKG
jgi:DNA polymerase-3 subunit epsilon